MEARTGRRRRLVIARLGVIFLLASLLTSAGCGGTAGVENGSIRGVVYGNAAGGSSSNSPLAGVTIAAVRSDGDPPVVRTTKSDANGEFVLTNLPTGMWTIGYDKEGFRTITTEEGNTADQTVVGNQIRVFVEPGATALAPDVNMDALPMEGDCTVVITVLDAITGQPVTNATVLVGPTTSSNGGTNGVYTLSVPVQVDNPNADASTQPSPQSVQIMADGYSNIADSLTPIANETVAKTISMSPLTANITGYIQVSAYDTLYTKDNTNIIISSDTVPRSILAQNIEASGFFTVTVPASNSALTRQFNLTFDSQTLRQTIVSNIVAPRAGGTRQLTSPVVMNPITVDVIGTVADSSGNAPNQLNPSGLPDTVTVVETGQTANIINGAYTIPDVPTTAENGSPAALNISVTAYNPTAIGPSGAPGVVETVTQEIKPVSDGSANPTFSVPLLVTGAAS